MARGSSGHCPAAVWSPANSSPRALIRGGEETGLMLRSPGRLAYVVNSTSERFPSSVALFFDSEDWDGDIASVDPDNDVVLAALVSLDEALALLAGSKASRPEIEPLPAYLRKPNAPVTVWSYRNDLPDAVAGQQPI